MVTRLNLWLSVLAVLVALSTVQLLQLTVGGDSSNGGPSSPTYARWRQGWPLFRPSSVGNMIGVGPTSGNGLVESSANDNDDRDGGYQSDDDGIDSPVEGMSKAECTRLRQVSNQVQPEFAYNKQFNPIVFIPGDGGSQLEAKLNKTTRVHYICSLVSDWFDLWLNIHLLAPYAFDCLCDNLRLQYNATSHATYNSEGVEIRAPNFGSVDSVAYLDILRIPQTDYFERIIATLEKSHNLQRNIDMRAAPFDFRKAPNELADFFANLSSLIEEQYVNSGYKPVTLICHSMGCLNSLYLLNRKPDNWKEMHVKRLITLGSPWDGSFKAINAMMFGDNLGIPLLNQEKLQALQSTFPSLMYLFPKVSKSFPADRVLVQAPDMNYTLKNLDLLFDRTKLLDQRDMWHDTKDIAFNLTAPGVEVWCLYGNETATPTKIVYDKDFESGKYHIELGDGDGTVNLDSLEACQHFREQQKQPVHVVAFQGLDHIQILRSNVPAEFISSHILVQDLDHPHL